MQRRRLNLGWNKLEEVEGAGRAWKRITSALSSEVVVDAVGVFAVVDAGTVVDTDGNEDVDDPTVTQRLVHNQRCQTVYSVHMH